MLLLILAMLFATLIADLIQPRPEAPRAAVMRCSPLDTNDAEAVLSAVTYGSGTVYSVRDDTGFAGSLIHHNVFSGDRTVTLTSNLTGGGTVTDTAPINSSN